MAGVSMWGMMRGFVQFILAKLKRLYAGEEQENSPYYTVCVFVDLFLKLGVIPDTRQAYFLKRDIFNHNRFDFYIKKEKKWK